MPQPSTPYVGLDVHKESIAVAYVAQEHEAAVTYLLKSDRYAHSDVENLLIVH
jgi:hypothetical protein